jgi:PIN domain nuclease of toxin-antitoxin system
LWEIALKVRAGKLALPQRWEFLHEHLTALGVRSVLPIEARHVFGSFQLPEHHRGRFDRLLIAQCQAERLPLIACDRLLRRCPIEVLW